MSNSLDQIRPDISVNVRPDLGANIFVKVFFMLFVSSADFIQNQVFRKILSGIPSMCQTVRIQIRPDIMSKLLQRLLADNTSR